MSLPKISVILPAYNHENYIQDTVLSILKQDVEDIEIIAVDDGSTDGTGEILDRLSATDSRLKVFHKANGGVASALRFAMAQASGEWIASCGSDDKVPAGAYRSLLRRAAKADVVIGSFYEIDDRGRKTRVRWSGRAAKSSCFASLFWMPATWNKLIRREFLLKNAVNFREVPICEDLILLAELAAARPRYAAINAPVYLYRNDASNYSSMTHVYTASWLKAHVAGRREVIRICGEAGIREAYAYVYGGSMAYLADHLSKLDGEELGEGLEEMQGFVSEGREYIDRERFETMFAISLDNFVSISAAEYTRRMERLSPEERILNKYSSGDIGLQFALRCIAQWFRYKFR